jgi:predicted deacetylase
MPAKYLIRFDDICASMNWEIWTAIEKLLVEFDVQPLLAIVPDNRDPDLNVGAPRQHFWDDVRRWQRRGWTIGLHGYQHHFVTDHAGIIGLNRRSEFAGLPLAQQEARLQLALAILKREDVRPDVWIAPAHSFDEVTIRALKANGITTISDGLFPLPHVDAHDVFWIPQQLWRFRRMPFGVWTICFHHNAWTVNRIARFRADLERYRTSIASVDEISREYRDRAAGPFDPLFTAAWRAAILARRECRSLRRPQRTESTPDTSTV